MERTFVGGRWEEEEAERVERLANRPHPLPLCEGDLDHVLGIVHVKDVFRKLAWGRRRRPARADATADVRAGDDAAGSAPARAQKSRVDHGAPGQRVRRRLGHDHPRERPRRGRRADPGRVRRELPRIREEGHEVDASCPLSNVKRELNLKIKAVDAETIGGS